MKFFVDSADITEITKLVATGFVDGVTTNPSLVEKSGKDFIEVIKDICQIQSGPVSAEVIATEYEGMVAEGRKLAKLADNVVVKLPLTIDGLRATGTLAKQDNIAVNVTLCFSAAQALLAAKAGAAYISPFVGRLDDIGQDGMELIADIIDIYSQYDFATEVLVASVRHPVHIVDSAKLGADVATVPPAILWKLFSHPLTDKGLQAFLADWAKTGQKII